MAGHDKDKGASVPAGWSEVRDATGPGDNVGDALAIDSRNCLVRSDGPMVVTIGCEDLVVIASEGAVLVVPRGEAHRVQEAIEAIDARRKGETHDD